MFSVSGEFSQSTMGNRCTFSRKQKSGPLSPSGEIVVTVDKTQLRLLCVYTPQALLGAIVVSSRVSFIQLNCNAKPNNGKDVIFVFV